MPRSLIRTAVIPVGGLGTRFLPATKAQPKEMIPVVDKPAIQYIVEEAVRAGISNIIFVTSHTKRAIEDHFDRNFELEYRLEQQKKLKELREVAAIGKLAKFAFVRQAKPQGDGDAVLAALPFIGNEPFAVLFGDDIIDSKVPCIGQLIDTYRTYKSSTIAVERVPKESLSRYGVVGGKQMKRGVLAISQFLEKPKPDEAPSNLGVIGRYILTPDVAALLTTLKADIATGKEVRLADAFVLAIKKGLRVVAREISGTRYDTGTKLGFLIASVEFGLRHPEVNGAFKEYLKKVCRR